MLNRPTSMKTGTRVRLRTFNGLPAAPPGIAPDENYWLLIGKLGTVRQDATEPSLHRLDAGHLTFDAPRGPQGGECWDGQNRTGTGASRVRGATADRYRCAMRDHAT